MRSFLAPAVVMTMALCATTGCKSGGASNSNSNWNFGLKGKSTPPASDTAKAPPQLPSSTATPQGYAQTPSSYTPGYPTTAPAGYADAGMAPASYPATGYPNQPVGYSNQGNPSYPQASIPNAVPPGAGYGNMPNMGVPTNQAAGVAPQAGPYNEGHGQTAAAATGYPASGVSYGNPQSPPQTPSSYPTSDPYAASSAGAAPTPPSDSYRAAAQTQHDPRAASEVAMNNPPADRYGRGNTDRYGNPIDSPNDAAAAERYAVSNLAAGDPAISESTRDDRYQPGNNGYVPGQNGYAPPGVPAYQSPADVNATSTTRRDPYYRPGGTGDYIPPSAGRVPPASTDRNRGMGSRVSNGDDPFANRATPASGYPAEYPATQGGAGY